VIRGCVAGPVHPYVISSPSCWALYGELLAAQYSDPARMRFHQLVVDSYAVQHPADNDPRAIRSVGIHLMTLCLFVERGVDSARGTQLHKRVVERPVFTYLPPPVTRGDITVADMLHFAEAGDARDGAFRWAHSAWGAWSMHHDVVRGWVARSFE
jgi:Family of unknown function (DUF5946)